VPHQGEVISTRDVIFDKENFFDKKDLSTDKELLAHMDELLARVSLEPSQAKNEEVLEEDEDLNPLPGSEPGNPKAPMTTKTKSCCSTKRKIIS
jgi:hypothetical protein